MNNNESLKQNQPLSKKIFKILLILHSVFLIIFLFFTFGMIILDDYFGLLSEYLLRIIFITLIIGFMLISIPNENKTIDLILYTLSLFILFFSFFITSSLIRDMPAYLNDDYLTISGQITDVKFKNSKYGDDFINKIYINGEEYKIHMQTITEPYFEKEYGMNSFVKIEYLKNSKQIISIN